MTHHTAVPGMRPPYFLPVSFTRPPDAAALHPAPRPVLAVGEIERSAHPLGQLLGVIHLTSVPSNTRSPVIAAFPPPVGSKLTAIAVPMEGGTAIDPAEPLVWRNRSADPHSHTLDLRGSRRELSRDGGAHLLQQVSGSGRHRPLGLCDPTFARQRSRGREGPQALGRRGQGISRGTSLVQTRDSFDLVAFRVEYESGVIVVAVFRTPSRRSGICASQT